MRANKQVGSRLIKRANCREPRPPSPAAVYVQDLLCDEDLDQARVAASGGGVQWRPQLVVLRVDAGSPVQQDLHHLFIVVNATLRWAERDEGAHC